MRLRLVPLLGVLTAILSVVEPAFAQRNLNVATPAANDRAFWETVKDSKIPGELKAYLDRFPEGLFAAIARTRLNSMEQTQGGDSVCSGLVTYGILFGTPPPVRRYWDTANHAGATFIKSSRRAP